MAKKEKPKTKCGDKKCPIHGNLKTKKSSFVGTVISDKMQKNATIAFDRIIKIPKYERYDKKRTKIKVHNPPCINARKGDLVKAVECRPISKTINYVIVEKYGKGDVFHERNEDLVQQKQEMKKEQSPKKMPNKEEKQ